jgi:hypothetical protein
LERVGLGDVSRPNAHLALLARDKQILDNVVVVIAHLVLVIAETVLVWKL